MTGRKETVLKNTGAYMLVRLIPQLTTFLLLPLYTRVGNMTPDDYGIVAIANTFSAMLTPLIGLKLAAAIPRYYFEHTGSEVKRYLSTILYTVFAVSILVMVVFVLAGPALTRLMFPKSNIPFIPYFALSLAALFFAELSQVVERFLIAQQQGGQLLFRALVSLPCGLAFGTWFVVINQWGAAGALLATACTSAVMFAAALWLVRNALVPGWERRLLMPSLEFSLPLIPHAFGSYLFIYSDRIVMEKFIDLKDIGLYNIGWKFASILKLFIFSVQNAILPNYMQLAKESGVVRTAQIFRPIITRWSVIIALTCLGLACFTEEVIMIMSDPGFHGAYLLVPVFVCGYVFHGLYTFASLPIFYLKKTRLIPVITVCAGLVNLGLNILLIPVFGYYGAALATAMAFMLMFVLAHLLSRKMGPMSYDRGSLIAVYAPVVLGVLILYALQYAGYAVRLPVKILLFGIYAAGLWIFNLGNIRNEWRTLWDVGRSLFRRRNR